MTPPWFTGLANPPFHLAAILLQWQLGNPQYAIESAGTAEYKGTKVFCVTTTLTSGIVQRAVTPQKWCFDERTLLPVFVTHRQPDTGNPAKFNSIVVEFGDFRVTLGVLLPCRLQSFEEGELVSTIAIEAVEVNASLSPSDFEPPAGDRTDKCDPKSIRGRTQTP